MKPNEREQAPKQPGHKPSLTSALSLEQAEALKAFEPDGGLEAVIETFQMDDVLLPGEEAEKGVKEVWDDAALPPSQASQMLGRFASGIAVEQRRQQIRFLTSRPAPPGLEPGPAAPLAVPKTLETVADDELADRLAAFAERVAEKTPGEKLVKLAGEGAKQFILEQLNPALQLTLGLTTAARHGSALKGWGEMSGAERLVHVSGFAEGVAEVLSAVTPPPAGPAIKVMGLGLVLVKVAAERSTPVSELPMPELPKLALPELTKPKPEAPPAPAPKPSGPPRGTRPLAAPGQRPGTGQLRMPAKPGTGALKPPMRGTGPLQPSPPPPPEDEGKIKELWNNLKRFWF
ncbi:MAG: hypothetical protein ACLGIN_18740 [Candidatus Sericytochromatia bacterium]